MKFPLVSNAYSGISQRFESSRTVNLRAELATDPNSKDIAMLIGTAGLKYLGAFVNAPCRALYSFNNELFAVIQSDFVIIDTTVSPWVVKETLGSLNTSTSNVVIKDNGLGASGLGGDQMIIVDGTDGYIFNAVTRVFSVITDLTGFKPTYVEYIDGYFVVVNDSMTTQCSDLLDGTVFNALATAQIMGASDNNRVVIANSEILFFIKKNTMELWQNIGTPTSQGFPFQRIQGAVINYGTESPYTWIKIFTNIYGLDPSGVVMLQGAIPVVISPPALNYIISQSTDLTGCFAYSYDDSGHTYYVLTNPTDNWTWEYDLNSQMWEERSSYVDDPYAIGRHLVNCHAWHNGMNIVGAYDSGNIYEMSSKYVTDAGKPICSMRVLSPVFDKRDLDPVFITKLMIDAETGVGTLAPAYPAKASAFLTGAGAVSSVTVTDGGTDYLNDTPPTVTAIPVDGQGTGAAFTAVVTNGSVTSVTVDLGGTGYNFAPILAFSGPVVDPHLGLSSSKDGGKTWSGEIPKPLGKIGEYTNRPTWRRLGHANNSKTFRLMCSDSCKKILMGAYIE